MMALGFGLIDAQAQPMSGPSQTGQRLLRLGAPAAALGGIVAGLAYAKMRGGARRAVIVISGAWPFVAFFVFLQWRIGLSGEQLSACDGGDAEACDVLAARKAKRGDEALARELYARGCELGNGHACLGFASIASTSEPEGAQALRDACALGEGTGCDRLSRALRRGDVPAAYPGERNQVAAQACALGVASACPP